MLTRHPADLDTVRILTLVIPAELPPACVQEYYLDGVKLQGEPDIPKERVTGVEIMGPPTPERPCPPLNIITR